MNRADLFAALEIALDPYPVVSHPLEAVMAPAFALGGSRRVKQPVGFGGYWSLTGIAGRMDEVDVFDTSETMMDLVCTLEGKLPRIAEYEQAAEPGPVTIGNVDYLVFTFTFFDYAVAGVCAT